MPDYSGALPPNFPRPPATRAPSLLTFPRDLLADGREFYSQIQFVPYKPGGLASMPVSGLANPVGGVVLPIPRKLLQNH